MSINKIKKVNSNHKRGDTLIEVLLSIAIVGTVLGATFVSANRSLRGMQQARDRSEAVTLVNTAITVIKQDRKKTPEALQSIQPNNNKYLDNNMSIVGSAPSPGIGTDGRFKVELSRGNMPDKDKYIVEISWESIMQNNEPEKIKLDYWAAE